MHSLLLAGGPSTNANEHIRLACTGMGGTRSVLDGPSPVLWGCPGHRVPFHGLARSSLGMCNGDVMSPAGPRVLSCTLEVDDVKRSWVSSRQHSYTVVCKLIWGESRILHTCVNIYSGVAPLTIVW